MKLLYLLGTLMVPLLATAQEKPNFIIFQADDLPFFKDWNPPAHLPNYSEDVNFPSVKDLMPNLMELRTKALRMRQAYAVSPHCGTSRYATITGTYPSRSTTLRDEYQNEDIAFVTTEFSKLSDASRGPPFDSCDDNLASILQEETYGYRTGVVGKWHLFEDHPENTEFDYSAYVQRIRGCGFDFAEGIYAENMAGFWTDGTFTHNLEYLGMHTLNFLEDDSSSDPFFLYVNPTVPHTSGVSDALFGSVCTATPEGYPLNTVNQFVQEKMGFDNCKKYRRNIRKRATRLGYETDNVVLAALWIDDLVGLIVESLEISGKLNNTFFLFQMDHGEEGKASLYETGIRIEQFIHFPSEFPNATGIDNFGLTSNLDIAPTILEYAGNKGSVVPMDGMSWKENVETGTVNSDRCLVFEFEEDRAIRCDCDKYMSMVTDGKNYKRGGRWGMETGIDVLFDLCDDQGNYIQAPDHNPEEADGQGIRNNDELLEALKGVVDCHNSKTSPMNSAGNFSDCPFSRP